MQRVTLLIIFIAMSSFGAGVLISNSDIIGGLSLFEKIGAVTISSTTVNVIPPATRLSLVKIHVSSFLI